MPRKPKAVKILEAQIAELDDKKKQLEQHFLDLGTKRNALDEALRLIIQSSEKTS